ncbi:MAG: PilZ domain-containing protein [Pirellulales bacterium]
MLADGSATAFLTLISQLPNKIELPRDLFEALSKERGVVDSTPFEARRSTRFRCSGTCIVEAEPGTRVYRRQELQSQGIVRDVSRSGVGVITHQQWFPGQRLRLRLEHATLVVEVARARKIASSCYEAGAIIVEHRRHEASTSSIDVEA